ncbi:uncharacterized protein LOC143610706 [Bidens hawaiensis]|uniref:uncharacterized protein LOC143610706 n=1 Tax=Bidens hawaiensis TaxID=980011 RepID=UPI00404A92C2
MADDSKKLSLKLLIDKKGQRVLFAEAGKDFVDFLFSLLALPVSSVIKLLEKQDMIGGLSNVYKSISDLNNDYLQSNKTKDVLLNPKSSLPYFSNNIQTPLLSTQASSSPTPTPHSPAKLYRCGHCSILLLASYATFCPTCKIPMTTHDDRYVLKSSVLNAQHPTKGFVKGLVTYMVMDDLAVSPLSTISNITLLNKFNIKDLGSLEEKVVHIGMNEYTLLRLGSLWLRIQNLTQEGSLGDCGYLKMKIHSFE